jgi:O-antigen/teichoic acid export membrane protein
MDIIKKIKSILGFGEGHERTMKARKNITGSFIVQALTILISFIQVPMTIGYLNPVKYGVWITLSSLVGWLSFFNVGLGNGLRNKFTEAVTLGDKKLAKVYVSTTYGYIAVFVTVVFIVFFGLNFFIDWNDILNINSGTISAYELLILALTMVFIFCVRLVVKLIATILTADQKSAEAAMVNLIGNVLGLLLLFYIVNFTKGSMLYLVIAISGSPIFVFLLYSIWLFNDRYKDYRPSIASIDYKQANGLFKIGMKFFVIQISTVLLLQTNNIIISQMFGPEQVTPFNISYKYFSITMMGFSIIINPFWSAFTEAWVKKEMEWIKKTMKRLLVLWGWLFILGIIMLVVSNLVFKLWIGDKIIVPFSLSVIVCFWVLFSSLNLAFSNFLNGVGILKLQLIIVIISSIINIPLSVLLGRYWGIDGVIMANLILAFVQAIIMPIQYYKIINNKAEGVWGE